MADAQKTLEIIISAQDRASSVLSSVGGRVSEFSGGVQDIAAPFAAAAAGAAALGTAAGVMAAGGVAQAAEMTGTFREKLKEVATLITDPTFTFEELERGVVTYASTSKKSTDEIIASQYAAISAGTDWRKSLELVGIAEQLAIGGKADLQSTTVALASTLNAYGADVSQATAYSDAFFTAVRDGQTTIPELSAYLAQVSSTAVAAGVSFDELLAGVATLTANGMPTSQAITSIKSALSNVIKPSKDAEEAAQGVGLQFNTTALQSKGLGAFLADLQQKTGGNIDTMARLFGSVEGLNGVMVLAGSGAGKFSATMDDMRNKAGATAEAYGKMAGEWGAVNQQLANNTDAIWVAFGGKIDTEYKGIITRLTGLARTLATEIESGSFDEVTDLINTWLKEAGAGIDTLAANLPAALEGVDWSGLASSLEEVKAAVGSLFDSGEIDLSTAEGLRTAIQEIIDTIEKFVRFGGGVVDGLKPIGDALKGLRSWFVSLDEETVRSIGATSGFMTTLGAASLALGILGNTISGVGTIIDTTSWFTGLGRKLLGSGGPKEAMETVSDAGKLLTNSIDDMIEGMNASRPVSAPWADQIIGKIGSIAKAAAAFAVTPMGMAILGTAAATAGINWGFNKLNENLDEEIKAQTEAYNASMDAINQQRQGMVEQARQAFADVGIEYTGGWGGIRDLVSQGVASITGSAADGTAALQVNFERLKEHAAGIKSELAGQQVEDALGLQKAADNARTFEAEMRRLGLVFDPQSGAFVKTPETGSKIDTVTASIQNSAASMKEAKEEADKLALKMEELASKERQQKLEWTAKLHISQFENDAKRMESALNSIGTTISSTGDLLGELWSTWADADGWEKLQIQAQIDLENTRRQQAIDQQGELIELERERNQIMIERLKSGGAIDIRADGLAPHVRAFMLEMLKEIRLQMSGTAEDFLLGWSS